MFQHTVKPGSYAWKYHRLPPRRRSNDIEMSSFFDDMLENLYAEDDLWDWDDELDYDDFTIEEDEEGIEMATLLLMGLFSLSDEEN